MGRFDYPSPYWDTVGDPALELIDRMMTVDAEKRITIDECLEHPWLTNKANYINPADSTDGLTGAMNQLDFARRKPKRERTLLSSINDIKISKVVHAPNANGPGVEADVNVWEKNPEGKKTYKGKTVAKEETPAANRQQEEFMEIGGKGDHVLLTDDASSRYLPEEVPSSMNGRK